MSETSSTTTANTDIEFQYQRPELVEGLSETSNLALVMGSTASRLVTELRTRTIHPDGRNENVSEHSHMLAKVAPYVAAELYPWMNAGRIALFSGLHDDPEMYVGDTPTDAKANHDQLAKEAREALAVVQHDKEFAPIVPFYTELMQRYEKQEEDEARFTRIMDKFMVVLIHIPNEGRTLRENYSYEQYIEATYATEKRLLDQYPEWIELIEARTELALYVGNKFIRDWNES